MYEYNNPTHIDTGFGDLRIIRLAPTNQTITVDITYAGKCDLITIYLQRQDTGETQNFDYNSDMRQLVIKPIWNDVEYQLHIIAELDGKDIARSRTRLVRAGYVPGAVVNYIHPDDYTYMPSGRSPASPSLIKLPDGSLRASHDVFWGECAQDLSFVFSSKDGGKTWEYLSEVHPCFWGKLFYHCGVLYMMGMAGEYGALMLFKSTDAGANWSKPVELMAGGDRLSGGPHQAPMPVIEHRGRLWTAIDYGAWALKDYHANGFISINIDADLMEPTNWVCTGFLHYDENWPGTVCGHSAGCIEGNAVVSPEGRLFNFLRYATNNCAPNVGRALILEADASKPDKKLRFHKIVKFPGNMSKFKIGFDNVSQRYWSLVSRVVTDDTYQRNLLTMVSSPDLIDWQIERDILNYVDNGWSEGNNKVGFQYVDWLLDGDDMLALSRTAINNAYNFHNANYQTFHRIHNFRRSGF